MTKAASGGIPHYYLYGDHTHDEEPDLLHCEPIHERSGPHDWRIRPHAHPGHLQLLLVQDGGGMIRFEDRKTPVPPQSILCIPAGIVHQIDFAPGTDGYAVTAALDCLRSACQHDAALAQIAALPAVCALDATGIDLAQVQDAFARLHREFLCSALGRRSAIIAQFMQILVLLLRLSALDAGQTRGVPAQDYDLLRRYRLLLDSHCRTERALAFYAAKLAVTPARLTAACKTRAGRTASELLHDRLITEAKRYLIYTDNSILQVAYLTGFDDPAYFNRFFTQRVGMPPGAFRKLGHPAREASETGVKN